jgi:hypothetical protein
LDAAEGGPVPPSPLAVTLKVYVVPFVSPEIKVLVSGGVPVTLVAVCAVLPMNGVTVYEVGGPPVEGGVQLTAATALPALAETFVGAPGGGGSCGVTAVVGADAGPLPLAFAAVTVNV